MAQHSHLHSGTTLFEGEYQKFEGKNFFFFFLFKPRTCSRFMLKHYFLHCKVPVFLFCFVFCLWQWQSDHKYKSRVSVSTQTGETNMGTKWSWIYLKSVNKQDRPSNAIRIPAALPGQARRHSDSQNALRPPWPCCFSVAWGHADSGPLPATSLLSAA